MNTLADGQTSEEFRNAKSEFSDVKDRTVRDLDRQTKSLGRHAIFVLILIIGVMGIGGYVIVNLNTIIQSDTAAKNIYDDSARAVYSLIDSFREESMRSLEFSRGTSDSTDGNNASSFQSYISDIIREEQIIRSDAARTLLSTSHSNTNYVVYINLARIAIIMVMIYFIQVFLGMQRFYTRQRMQLIGTRNAVQLSNGSAESIASFTRVLPPNPELEALPSAPTAGFLSMLRPSNPKSTGEGPDQRRSRKKGKRTESIPLGAPVATETNTSTPGFEP